MSTTLHRIEERDVPTVSDARAASRVAVSAAGLLAALGVVVGVVGAHDRGRAIAWAALVLVAAFALSTLVNALARPREPMWMWLAAGTIGGGLALRSDRFLGVVPLLAAAIGIALPDGWVRTGAARIALGLAAAIGISCAVIVGLSDAPPLALLVGESLAAGFVAIVAYLLRCRSAAAVERARLQWAGWGAVVAGSCALLVWLMHELVGWPDGLGAPIVALASSIPLAITLASFDQLALRVDRLLVRTIEVGGLVALVGVVYLVVVLGFGQSPTDATRRVVGLSLVAAAISALLFVPARNWLEELANRRVYGERRAPDEPLQTFGARMSRAIPLDELLLQLAESLKKSMQLSNAEVWTGTGGVFERAAAVPYREVARVRLNEEESMVVARAHVSGNAWIQVWLPAVLAEHPGRTLRVAPLVLSGELFGFILCARQGNQQPFSSEEERVLTDLARQVAVALHNSALDTALQASLDDLRVANEELRASRSRIVATADQSRRQIERNLHDGAQQHLVALAVKLGLARQLVDGDREMLATLLEELRGDAQTTLTELRELAHGIYPPLLMDRGLREALVAAANRSQLPTEVEADVARYQSDVEAAIYFCCLEALQNAGKHAGEQATIKITLGENNGMLRFQVQDDGAGFDATASALRGHGFVNMADRLGAIGGNLEVVSAPGEGTRIGGTVPLDDHDAGADRSSHS
ncbi:MAG TPA: histidine kinase [Acidimicrobiia bacterium]|nr:histidine kinase [Acidimicrobiia bacterium]